MLAGDVPIVAHINIIGAPAVAAPAPLVPPAAHDACLSHTLLLAECDAGPRPAGLCRALGCDTGGTAACSTQQVSDMAMGRGGSPSAYGRSKVLHCAAWSGPPAGAVDANPEIAKAVHPDVFWKKKIP
eukprot:71254-Chlamydomonas_euryale.AAC.8